MDSRHRAPSVGMNADAWSFYISRTRIVSQAPEGPQKVVPGVSQGKTSRTKEPRRGERSSLRRRFQFRMREPILRPSGAD